ncbi:MAG: FixH family protein [Prevotella sp.]|jgi:hypothetical protein|nr:FixH family protein [Prevotella sp.]
MNKTIYSIIVLSTIILTSCNSNDDVDNGLKDSGITITDDVDCCSAEEALQVYNFLKTKKIIPELTKIINDKYNVFAYSDGGTLHTGYNDLYFVATKRVSGNYIKNFRMDNIVPLMNMSAMNMQHSTAVADSSQSFNKNYLAVKRSWIAFVMNSSEKDKWNLSYDLHVLSSKDSISHRDITVDSLTSGQRWLRSFKVGDNAYVISLVNPNSWQTGTNTIQAYISQKATPLTSPWLKADKQFTVEFTPTMPDMGNHTSPNNQPLLRQTDGSYQGTINLTMTGLWRLHLTVRDSSGTVVAGGDTASDGFSSLYLDITI